MPNQKLFPEKLPDCIEEPAKAALQPVGEAAGGIISDIMKLALWPLTIASKLASGQQEYILERQKVKHAQQLEVYAKEIKEKLEKIPEEKRIEPDTRIVWDAFEKSRSAIGVDEIRRLYANLIANAANADVADQIHPSFSTIISQLSSLDVQNLEIIADGVYCPIANFIKYPNDGKNTGNHDLATVHTDVFLLNPNNQDIITQAVSINSLARLQLVTIDYGKSAGGDTSYSDIQTYFDEHFKDAYSPEFGTKFEKGIVTLTPFGHAFLAACHSPFDPISETSVEL